VGLTLRVGRRVRTVDIIQDIVESGKSVLILGAPGGQDDAATRGSAHPG